MAAGRRWYVWAGWAYLAILLTVFLGLTRQHAAARRQLEESLGQRLLGIAASVADLADGERIFYAGLGDEAAAGYLAGLTETCRGLRRRAKLAQITLTDPLDARVLATTDAALVPGEADPYWDLNPGPVHQAAGGRPAVTALHEVPGAPGVFQMTAYAPVYNFAGESTDPVAVVAVSGNPDFFAALADLRRTAWLTGAVVIVILAGLGVVLFRVNLALERTRAAARRQEQLAVMGRMAAGIAHEIRNPLGIIRGAGQHLQRVLDEAGLEDEVVEFIPDEVDRLDRILGGYLALGAERTAEPQDFDLAEAVQRGLRLADADLADAGVALETGPPVAAWVRGDPHRLQQVVLNLVLNARDAARSSVAVRMEVAGGRVRLTVRDDGPGLQGRDPERCFEPFWTDKEKGSGLGLAISRRIVEDMSGTLTLAERTGAAGAVATVDLPLARPEE